MGQTFIQCGKNHPVAVPLVAVGLAGRCYRDGLQANEALTPQTELLPPSLAKLEAKVKSTSRNRSVIQSSATQHGTEENSWSLHGMCSFSFFCVGVRWIQGVFSGSSHFHKAQPSIDFSWLWQLTLNAPLHGKMTKLCKCLLNIWPLST